MNKIDAYHMTDISHLKSIVKDGLVPDIGKSSRGLPENNFLVYFTVKQYIDKVIDMLGMNNNTAVILNFECDDYGNRGEYLDCCTKKHIYPNEIRVIVDDEQIDLEKYYKNNRERIDLYHDKAIVEEISHIQKRLNEIKNKEIKAEDDPWDYDEVDPSILSTLDLLKLLRYSDSKDKYIEVISQIKDETYEKLLNNDLNITEESEFYKTLDYLFSDSLKDVPKIDISLFNYIMTALIINLYYRQCERYNRIGKKESDENNIWSIDRINYNDLPDNEMLNKLIMETKQLHDKINTSSYNKN